MRRFFVDPPALASDRVAISGPLAHRLVRVLRMSAGDEVALFDGSQVEVRVRLDEASDRAIMMTVLERYSAPAESRISVHLYQCVTKGERFEWLIEKATELGVHAITPLVTGRSVVRARGDGNRSERWRRIATEAGEQCGRAIIPAVGSPMRLEEALANAGESVILLPYEEAPAGDLSVRGVLDRDIDALFALGAVSIFIGPEGGFERAEVERAQGARACVVTMGRRVLRSETAGLVALTLVMQAIGELG